MTEYPLINAAAFAGLGVLVFFIAFAILRRVVPGDLWKEILQERNMALAVLVGLMSLGLAVVIAATMH